MLQRDNLFQTLNKLDKNPLFEGVQHLARVGVIPFYLIRQYEIYLRYDSFLKTGFSKRESKDKIITELDIDIRSLNRTIKAMESK